MLFRSPLLRFFLEKGPLNSPLLATRKGPSGSNGLSHAGGAEVADPHHRRVVRSERAEARASAVCDRRNIQARGTAEEDAEEEVAARDGMQRGRSPGNSHCEFPCATRATRRRKRRRIWRSDLRGQRRWQGAMNCAPTREARVVLPRARASMIETIVVRDGDGHAVGTKVPLTVAGARGVGLPLDAGEFDALDECALGEEEEDDEWRDDDHARGHEHVPLGAAVLALVGLQPE